MSRSANYEATLLRLTYLICKNQLRIRVRNVINNDLFRVSCTKIILAFVVYCSSCAGAAKPNKLGSTLRPFFLPFACCLPPSACLILSSFLTVLMRAGNSSLRKVLEAKGTSSVIVRTYAETTGALLLAASWLGL